VIACASAQTSVESTTATASVSASGSTAACDVAKYQVCIGDLGKCLSDANGDKTKTCACYPTFFTCSKPFSVCSQLCHFCFCRL
jgi:hypothetical protein